MAMPPPPPDQNPGWNQPYGYQPYGWGAREHPQGTTVLVLGILSLVVCGLIGPFAWSMGNTALEEIDANPAAYSNRSAVQAGRICGIVATCLLIATVAIFVIVLVVAAGTSST